MEIGIHCHRYPMGENDGPASPAPGGLMYDSVRTHDGGVQWHDLNPAPGVYNWARMDAIVAAHPDKSIVYTIYGTPTFALVRPSDASYIDAYGSPGGAGAAKQADLIVFVTALLARYSLKAVEVWNEPKFDGVIRQQSFFWGSAGELVLMAIGVRTAVNRLNAANKTSVEVWSPGFDTVDSLRQFLMAGMIMHGASLIDVVAYHFYGCDLGPTNNILTHLAEIRHELTNAGIPRATIVISEYGIGVSASDPKLLAYNALTEVQRYMATVANLVAMASADVYGVYFYAIDQPLCGDLIHDIGGTRKGVNDLWKLLQ